MSITPDIINEPDVVKNDLLRLLVGKCIGHGASRNVYLSNTDPNVVVKVETPAWSFQNIAEWDMWHSVKGTKWEKWFAPCINISPCGMVLLQAKTHPMPPELAPKSIPNFFTDIKFGNFGLLNGRPVVHDYGYNRCHSLAISSGRMRKVDKKEWW